MAVTKSIEATNPLEKSFTNADNTDVDEEIMKCADDLEKADESSV